MVIDLNRIFMYADGDGYWQDRPTRHMLRIVEGIVGGESNGPPDPTPKRVGMVLASRNTGAGDLVCAHLMGFDYGRLSLTARSFAAPLRLLVSFDASEVIIAANDPHFSRNTLERHDSVYDFKPHLGWKVNTELSTERGRCT
jgi:hypothetical protein